MDLNNFLGFLNELSARIEEKDKEKGDSWKTLPPDYLRKKLVEEFYEWNRAVDKRPDESIELLDLGICCLLLWNRLEE